MRNKLFILPLMLVMSLFVVQAAVVTNLFYDSTNGNSETIFDGESVGVIISADSVGENNMKVTLDLLDNQGNLVANLIDVGPTTNDFYENYLIFGKQYYGSVGDYTFVSTVVGSSGKTTSDQLTLKVNPVKKNSPPVITSKPVIVVNEQAQYTYDVDATDADGDKLTYYLLQSPSWLSINLNTGLITGTAPEVDGDKAFGVRVQVSDGEAFATQDYILTVKDIVPENHAPTAYNQNVETNEDTKVIIKLQAEDSDGDFLSYSIISNPKSGVLSNFNTATGIISYTPAKNFFGSDSFTFKVNDGQLDSNVATVSIKVKEINHKPKIISKPIKEVKELSNYAYDVDATDEDGDFLSYSLEDSPNWLSIDSVTGLISGMAPEVDKDTQFDVVVSVTDGRLSDSQDYVLTVLNVKPKNHAPIITSKPVTFVIEKEVYEYQVTATDADGDVLRYSLIEKPTWLGINPNTGLITGIAPEVSANTVYSVTVSVSDGELSDSQSYVITVKNIVKENKAPIAYDDHLKTKKNTPLSISLMADDPDGDVLRYIIVSDPEYGSLSDFNVQTGELVYTPNDQFTGVDVFEFKANDGQLDSNIETIEITVIKHDDKNHAPEIISHPEKKVKEKTLYEYQVVAIDEDNDILTYSLIESPSWLNINSATGLISGVAPYVSKEKEFRVTVSVSDGELSDSQSYDLTVYNRDSHKSHSDSAGDGVGLREIPINEREQQEYIAQYEPAKTISLEEASISESQTETNNSGSGLPGFGISLVVMFLLVLVVLALIVLQFLR